MPVSLPTTPSKRLQILNRLDAVLTGLGYTVERNRTQAVDFKTLPAGPTCVLRDGPEHSDHLPGAPPDAWPLRWVMEPEIFVVVDLSDPATRPVILDATSAQIVAAIKVDQQTSPQVSPGNLRSLLAVKTGVGVEAEPIYTAEKDNFAGVRLTLSMTYDK